MSINHSHEFSSSDSSHIMNNVSLGDVYIINIVPSSTLGNGSVTTATISKPTHKLHTVMSICGELNHPAQLHFIAIKIIRTESNESILI